MNHFLRSKCILFVISFGWVWVMLSPAAGAESSSSTSSPTQSTGGKIESSDVFPSPEVHWRAHAQAEDLFKTWNFDQEPIGGLPTGFSAGSNQKESTGKWSIEADPQAPSTPHVMTQTHPCSQKDCFHVLLSDTGNLKLPDIVVSIREMSSGEGGEAGIVLAAQDHKNFYAVTVNLHTKELSTYRVQNGKPMLIGKGPAIPKPGTWHVLRVQVVNSGHVDFPRLELYLDGWEVPMPEVYAIEGVGGIGVITMSEMVAKFDGLRVIEMVANRTFSKPAAY